VEVYLETANRAMSEEGSFFLVFQTRSRGRVLDSAKACGLYLRGQADFLMRRDREEPFLSVFEFSRVPTDDPHYFSCPVREADGEISAEYQEIRRELGVAAPPSSS
jgi:hypothetical protein